MVRGKVLWTDFSASIAPVVAALVVGNREVELQIENRYQANASILDGGCYCEIVSYQTHGCVNRILSQQDLFDTACATIGGRITVSKM